MCSPFDRNCFKKESVPVAETMVQLWKKHIGQDVLLLTKKRSSLLRSALKLLFNDDLTGWESMCKQVKDSPFLMGKGDKGWHITLDWLLREDNLVKILEGNFDSPETLEKKRKDAYTQVETAKKWDLLNTIQDPLWKEWCTKLAFPPSFHKPGIAACELEDLLNARFREFDGRIVIIESDTQRCHERIEKLWMELGEIARQTYPTSRRVSSELIKPSSSAQTTNPQTSP